MSKKVAYVTGGMGGIGTAIVDCTVGADLEFGRRGSVALDDQYVAK